jgi:tetratricopeptide (TPR) repeat protein
MTRRTTLLLAATAAAQGLALALGSHLLRRRSHARNPAGGPDPTVAALRAIEARLAAIEAALSARDAGRTEPPAWSEPEFPRTRPAASYLDEGNVYFEIGQIERALERFERAIALDPTLAAAYYNRANALRRLGDPAAALLDYDCAAVLLPDDAEVLNNRGLTLLDAGRTDDAIADFVRAAALQPDDAAIAVNLAAARLEAGDAPGALAEFERALVLQPAADAEYGAALALTRLGRGEEALERLARALAREPGLGEAAVAEPAFAALRADPRFASLLAGSSV